MRKSIDWVYDIENTIKIFMIVFEDVHTSATKHFIIHHTQNDIKEIITFLRENIHHKDRHLGYNNIGYDGPLIQYILENTRDFYHMPSHELIAKLYAFGQMLIDIQGKDGEFPPYNERDFSIPQIDVYKMNGWDTNAKRAGLKWIQFTMNMENIEDMPFSHDYPVLSYKEVGDMLSYCYSDVSSTKKIFNIEDSSGKKLTWEQLDLRKEFSELYNVNVYSAAEPTISKEIFLHFLSEELGVSKQVIRKKRTLRDLVKIKDVILPSIKFDTPEFNDILIWFQSLEIDTSNKSAEDIEKKGPKFSIFHKNVKTDFGLGGIHGCHIPGVFVADEKYIIKSADVTSFYPMLAIMNSWHPEHIPAEVFCRLYLNFFNERKKYPKGTPLNYLFKIVLNAIYGLSKSRHSFLYDPMFTYRITVNGQLLLARLYEMLSLAIPDSVPLMQNTDGLEFRIRRADEHIFNRVCEEWEAETKLNLEYDNYKKLIISDVNSYIGVYDTGKTKCKGRFEYEGRALHKNSSYTIVPKAIFAYFIHGISPKDSLSSNTNILDYCGGVKMQKGWYLQHQTKSSTVSLQKTLRYYNSSNSNANGKILKRHEDGRILQLEAGQWLQQTLNVYDPSIPWEDYSVDKAYYEQKIIAEIDKIRSPKKHIKKFQKAKTEKFKPQLSLF